MYYRGLEKIWNGTSYGKPISVFLFLLVATINDGAFGLIVHTDKEVHALAGQKEVVLTCFYEPMSKPEGFIQLVWRRAEGKRTVNYCTYEDHMKAPECTSENPKIVKRYSLEVDYQSSGNLTIRDVSPDDADVYTCDVTAVGQIGSSSDVKLVVNDNDSNKVMSLIKPYELEVLGFQKLQVTTSSAKITEIAAKDEMWNHYLVTIPIIIFIGMIMVLVIILFVKSGKSFRSIAHGIKSKIVATFVTGRKTFPAVEIGTLNKCQPSATFCRGNFLDTSKEAHPTSSAEKTPSEHIYGNITYFAIPRHLP